jgi:MFS family permease
LSPLTQHPAVEGSAASPPSKRQQDADARASAGFPPVAVAWAAVGILVVLAVLSYLDRQIVSLMVQMIKADFGVSDSRMGLLQGAAFSLVFSLAAFPFGFAVDRYSRRVVLFVGVFAWALAATACGLATSFNTLLAARLGVGLGEAALTPAVASMLSDLFPKKRLAFAFAVWSVGALIGTWGALVIGGVVLYWAGDGMTLPLLGHLAPWKVAFIVTGAPGLLLAFVIFLIPEPKRRVSAAEAATKPSWSDAGPFLRQSREFLICYMGGFSILAMAGYSLMSWAPTVLQRVHGMTPGATGLALGPAMFAGGLIGTLTAGAVVDRMYARGRRDAHVIYYSLGASITIAAGIASAFAPSPAVYIVIMASSIFALNFGGVATAGLQLLTPAHLRGRITALFGFCTTLAGATLGPSLVPFFTDVVFRDETKVHWSLAATIGCTGLLGGILLSMARKSMRRAVDAAEALG